MGASLCRPLKRTQGGALIHSTCAIRSLVTNEAQIAEFKDLLLSCGDDFHPTSVRSLAQVRGLLSLV